MIKIFACFLLGCVVLTFGARRERIGYGRDVTELELKEKFPFMVYVHVCNPFSFGGDCNFCSGTLVKPDRVVVAAHCYCGIGSHPTTTVWSKTLKLGKGTATAGGRITSGMPKFKCGVSPDHMHKDIALIGLIEKLDVKPVQLYCKKRRSSFVLLINGKKTFVQVGQIKVPLGEKVWMVGFGENEKKVQGPLRIATARLKLCPHWLISQHPFCVRSAHGEPTMLTGDSGGPLLIKRGGRFIQIGVAAFGKTFESLERGNAGWNAWADISPFCQAISNARK